MKVTVNRVKHFINKDGLPDKRIEFVETMEAISRTVDGRRIEIEAKLEARGFKIRQVSEGPDGISVVLWDEEEYAARHKEPEKKKPVTRKGLRGFDKQGRVKALRESRKKK